MIGPYEAQFEPCGHRRNFTQKPTAGRQYMCFDCMCMRKVKAGSVKYDRGS